MEIKKKEQKNKTHKTYKKKTVRKGKEQKETLTERIPGSIQKS